MSREPSWFQNPYHVKLYLCMPISRHSCVNNCIVDEPQACAFILIQISCNEATIWLYLLGTIDYKLHFHSTFQWNSIVLIYAYILVYCSAEYLAAFP